MASQLVKSENNHFTNHFMLICYRHHIFDVILEGAALLQQGTCSYKQRWLLVLEPRGLHRRTNATLKSGVFT